MSIRIICPACKAGLRVADGAKQVRCPKCTKLLLVPQPTGKAEKQKGIQTGQQLEAGDRPKATDAQKQAAPPRPSKKEKAAKSGSPVFLLAVGGIALLLLLLIGGGFAGWYFWPTKEPPHVRLDDEKSKKDKDKEGDPKKEPDPILKDPEKLFRAMENKLVAAKTIKIRMEGTMEFGFKMTSKTTAVLGEGNQVQIESTTSDGKHTIKSYFVSDGGQMLWDQFDGKPAQTAACPKNLGVHCRKYAVGGVQNFPSQAMSPGGLKEEEPKLMDFKLGARAKVGDADTQIVECSAEGENARDKYKYRNAIKIWIDTTTLLPAKMEGRSEIDGKTMATITATYLEWTLDTRVDAKTFALKPPPQTEAIPIDAVALVAEFKANATGAKQKYQGKLLDVTGQVGLAVPSVKPATMTFKAEKLDGKTLPWAILCVFDKEPVPQLSQLEPDHTVTIRGRFTSTVGDTIFIKECALLKRPLGPTDAGQSDRDKLQGTWVITAAEIGGKIIQSPARSTFTFDKDKVVMKDEGSPDKKGTIKLDTGKSPKQMDLTSSDPKDKEVMQGIYELQGDTLKIAYSAKGPKGIRPASFDSKDAAIMHLEREKTGDQQAIPPKEVAKLKHGAKPVTVVVYSPSGKMIASGTGGGNLETNEVKLWDAATNAELKVRIENPNAVWTSLAFSPDNRFLAGAAMGRAHVFVWDVATGQETAKLPHKGSVWAVAWSPDRKSLAASDEYGIVKIWDVAARTTTAEFKLTNDRALGVAFSPDGKLLATSDADRSIKLWDLETRKMKSKWAAGHVPSVAFSTDGKLLVAGSVQSDVRLWDIETEKRIGEYKGHADEVRFPAISPNGRHLATMGMFNADVKLWDRATAKEIATLKGQSKSGLYIGLAFSPDGNRLAAGSNNTITIWDVSNLGDAKASDQHKEKKRYADKGIIFEYPKSWELKVQGTEVVTVSVTNEISTDATFQVHPAGTDPKALRDVTDKNFRMSTKIKLVKGSEKTVKRKFAGNIEEGISTEYETGAFVQRIEIFAFALPSKKGVLCVILGHVTLYAEKAIKDLDMIVESFSFAERAGESVIAQVRFSDKKGDDTGWAAPWVGPSKGAVIQKKVAFEGGPALHLSNGGYNRRVAEPQKGRFVVEQHVQVPNGGGANAYFRDGEGGRTDGPVWRAADGKFLVLAQDNKWIETLYTVEAGKWHKVVVTIDVTTRTWEFAVDGRPFKSPQPLQFRTKVDQLDTLRYQCENVPGIYIGAVRILRSAE
jgi:uncharacterized protein (TIGR03067 family)